MNPSVAELMLMGALFVAFRRLMGCDPPNWLGFAWFVNYLVRMVDRAIQSGTDAVVTILEGSKHLLGSVGLSFLTPLIDAAIAALKSSADALMSPLVKAALFAVLGAWLILRLLKR